MKNTALLFGIGILLISCQRIHQPSGWNTKNIQIARDEFGVPHIFGKSDADAAYGLAWAHAEDDFETIQKTVLAGKGLAGRVFGRKFPSYTDTSTVGGSARCASNLTYSSDRRTL